MIQFDEHIFQMGWFNHQPVLIPSVLSRVPFVAILNPPEKIPGPEMQSNRGKEEILYIHGHVSAGLLRNGSLGNQSYKHLSKTKSTGAAMVLVLNN